MSGIFMDFPAWTPEQRLSVALVEVLLLKRELKYPRSTPANTAEITHLPACTETVLAGTQSKEST